MKRKKTLLVAIALLLSFAQIFAQPKIQMLETETNFGEQNYQNTLSEYIKFVNVGNDTLEIIDVKPGCGCTVVAGATHKIPPGDTGKILVSLNIKTFTGQIVKNVAIYTNDPAIPRVSYLLKCDVIRPFVINPRYLSFDKLYVGEEGTINTIIKNTSNVDAKIKFVERSSPLMLVNIKEGDVIKAGESFTLISKITPTEKGHIRENLKLHLEHPDEEFIDLSAYGRAIIREK